MLNNEYFTVNELSKELGITKQAIYKRLKYDLDKYVMDNNGQKLLHKSIIEEFNKNTKNNISDIKESHLNEINSNLKKQLEDKETLINRLFNQIESLTTQVSNLTKEIETQNKHNREQSTQLVELIKQVNELQRNNQILLAQNNEQIVDISNENKEQPTKTKWFNWFK